MNTVYVVKHDFKINDRDFARKILQNFELPFSFIEYADNRIELQNNKLDSTEIVTIDSRSIINIDDVLKKNINWFKKYCNESAL